MKIGSREVAQAMEDARTAEPKKFDWLETRTVSNVDFNSFFEKLCNKQGEKNGKVS